MDLSLCIQIIGIMDCQEWQEGNIASGHQQFQQILAKVEGVSQLVKSVPVIEETVSIESQLLV